MDPLAIDVPPAADDGPDAAIAIARMLLSKSLDLLKHSIIPDRTGLIEKGGAVELHEGTGALHR
jgi:hypothetical protein